MAVPSPAGTGLVPVAIVDPLKAGHIHAPGVSVSGWQGATVSQVHEALPWNSDLGRPAGVDVVVLGLLWCR